MTFRNLLSGLIFLAIISPALHAQNQQLYTSQQFRLGERIIRIAEPGQLADSINVWGDVGAPGRYIVPKGTNLAVLISYGFGPKTIRDGQTNVDWSKMRVEVYVNRFDEESNTMLNDKFNYRFEDPLPSEMYSYHVENGQTISVRVKRRPSFRDYLSVIAPTISAIATSIIVVDRLNGN